MSGAAINAALRAATQARIGHAIKEPPENWRNITVFAEDEGDMAAAVAAFLPKAQDAYMAHYGSPSPQIAWLIAAVEAAREAGDG